MSITAEDEDTKVPRHFALWYVLRGDSLFMKVLYIVIVMLVRTKLPAANNAPFHSICDISCAQAVIWPFLSCLLLIEVLFRIKVSRIALKASRDIAVQYLLCRGVGMHLVN